MLIEREIDKVLEKENLKSTDEVTNYSE